MQGLQCHNGEMTIYTSSIVTRFLEAEDMKKQHATWKHYTNQLHFYFQGPSYNACKVQLVARSLQYGLCILYWLVDRLVLLGTIHELFS
jgi:hypothetical protein